MRIKFSKQGGHYHCLLFTKSGPHSETWALCGTLVFAEWEWPEMQRKLSSIGTLEESQKVKS